MANPFNVQNNGQNQVNMNDLLANMKRINNPTAIRRMIINKNPQLAQMLRDIEASGMHPVQYLTQQAIARNINISPAQIQQLYNEIESQLK